MDRVWELPNGESVLETLPEIRSSGWSLKFMCCFCGGHYARVGVFINQKLQPYKFVSRCCSVCSDNGNNFYVPGTLEVLDLLNWHVPIEVALYQLNVELDYLSHPQHPHNKDHYSD